MKGLIIIPSVRELKHWHKYEENAKENNFDLNDIEVLVIDENPKNRKVNDKILENVNHYFYGLEERIKWLNDKNIPTYIIPLQCHAETSFGLLYAYNKNIYDYIIFIDDDTLPTQDNYFGWHINQLFGLFYKDIIDAAGSKWSDLLPSSRYFARGFPYCQRGNEFSVISGHVHAPSVMNQGLWCGQLDLNSTDILPHLNGLTEQIGYNFYDGYRDSIVIGEEGYTTVCSMNLAFKSEIIPAFYQLPMNHYDFPLNKNHVDRFDDIWSGIILKKIADHLGKFISHGRPICEHQKEPRNTLKDVVTEAKGLEINEYFWKIIDEIEIPKEMKTWKTCYEYIAFELQKYPDTYINFLGGKMNQWIEVIDQIEANR